MPVFRQTRRSTVIERVSYILRSVRKGEHCCAPVVDASSPLLPLLLQKPSTHLSIQLTSLMRKTILCPKSSGTSMSLQLTRRSPSLPLQRTRKIPPPSPPPPSTRRTHAERYNYVRVRNDDDSKDQISASGHEPSVFEGDNLVDVLFALGRLILGRGGLLQLKGGSWTGDLDDHRVGRSDPYEREDDKRKDDREDDLRPVHPSEDTSPSANRREELRRKEERGTHATSNVSIPDRPTATATTIEGTMPISLVTSRRTRGDVFHSMKPSETT